MNGKDYYAILGIDRNATDKEIRSAFRRLAKKYHPDRNSKDPSAEAKFKEVNEAYSVLRDKEKRSQYDRFGTVGQAWQQAGGPGGYTHVYTDGEGFDAGGLGDLFETFFGSRRRARPGPTRRRQDISYPIELTLREAFAGTTRSITLNVTEACSACRGKGASGNGIRTCSSCGGSGRPSNRGGIFTLSDACEACGGRGEVIVSPCQTCQGRGEVQRPRRLEVKIPAGVAEGQKIRVAGQGPGGGDMLLVVNLKPDPFFSRKGDDLWCEVPITFPEAALGAEIQVPTLNGKVKVSIPPETSSGQALRLGGLGFPKSKSSAQGDQYVKVRIVTPKQLKSEEKELIRRLSEMRPEKPDRGRV
ncbi:MAG: molecular chaperone DnaJ [Armatimonadetes bacterium]|nr:molecular chaperone DnaJ [Armatimonadota bacterium]NIM24230.1 molecular chaperone DnaJ [Armatimonadota bacterium]NIM68099.1 molecular chaperone DnaJ [Armatimonadota bacterium]NIM76561.1 molecular chaperone DnaJ [Armatimonadota bacterium]NIN06304.1 molecular chaperone DnaJ [Armatimonadota bacterium]